MPNHRDSDPNGRQKLIAAICASPSYRLAQEDHDFLESDAARAARLQLELMRPEVRLKELDIRSTVVVFGSARVLPLDQAQRHLALVEAQTPTQPTVEQQRKLQAARKQVEYAHYYEESRQFAMHLSSQCQTGHSTNQCRDLVIVTGGGPGVMEAANRGAWESGDVSAGFNIQLPREQTPNPYITPDLAFRFHYFAMRKMHFMLRAQALVAFPGGYGTMDELFEALTLVQTGKMQRIPIVLVGKKFWRRAIDFQFLLDEGLIDAQERELATLVDTGVEAAEHVLRFHRGDSAQK